MFRIGAATDGDIAAMRKNPRVPCRKVFRLKEYFEILVLVGGNYVLNTNNFPS